MNFILKNGKKVFCDRPDKINAVRAIDAFYDLYYPLIGGKSMWALDIGTACGDSTVVMAACLGQNSRIICFEPGRETISLLKDNLKQNTFCQYDIHHSAASNEFGELGFVSSSDNGGIVLPEFFTLRGKSLPEYTVPSVNTLDYLKSEYKESDLNKIGFIKIDCEGYDYIILENLAELIKKNKSIAVVEWWPDVIVSDKLFAIIEKMGYKAYNTNLKLVTSKNFLSDYTLDLILKPNE